ncbi:GDSL-type esterase/lipase family protein (plasmid) [Natrinema zhouii]|uniref:GDSL-type esterase/lipase family protein n=1 Tax=Natrinema zhouii TaxID=1710539 RepID=UPI001CFFB681|nr:GDSL-type esterase/lipase family protein [Natrinema zhouii]UHQ98466.1 GDSL-type esterase/lipase family protein [Natrinema zhouii]
MHYDGIQFHNVGDMRPIEGQDGKLLQRVPEAVKTELNDGAQSRMRHPAGVELRFVPDGPVRVTLSTVPGGSSEDGTVRVFWGPIQSATEIVVGDDPTTIAVSLPEKLTDLEPSAREALAFDPRVCRIQLPGEHRGGPMVYHGLKGDVRPPREEELPDRRYLAYGTSITEGEAPLGEHLNYVSQTARRLDADPINLGSCGTAYCDTAMADHIAERDDWDIATLSISVNMVGTFAPEEFRERAAQLIDRVASAHPDKPVVAITIFRNARDVCRSADPDGTCERFREELRKVVAETPHENVHLLEGPELLPTISGLTPDLVHPGDDAMITIGENLAAELESLLED